MGDVTNPDNKYFPAIIVAIIVGILLFLMLVMWGVQQYVKRTPKHHKDSQSYCEYQANYVGRYANMHQIQTTSIAASTRGNQIPGARMWKRWWRRAATGVSTAKTVLLTSSNDYRGHSRVSKRTTTTSRDQKHSTHLLDPTPLSSSMNLWHRYSATITTTLNPIC